MNRMALSNVVANPDRHDRFNDIRAFGIRGMAYSALQEEIKEFRYSTFEGFIPYMTAADVDYVLSDPITAERDFLAATIMFLSRGRKTVFCQISKKYAYLLSHLGFAVNGFGVENIVCLPEFKVGWRNKKCLKSYLSKLEKQNYYVFEYDADSDRMGLISREWLAGKQKSKELRFMARPFTGLKEEDVRYFHLIKDNQVIGFCTFDPVYAPDGSGRVSSYALQHLRVVDGAPLGSQDYLILHALFQFKEEGFQSASLGLSPLHKRDNQDFPYSKLAEAVFAFIYGSNAFYRYRTIGAHKDHYKAEQVQTYIASPDAFTPRKLFGLLKVNNLV